MKLKHVAEFISGGTPDTNTPSFWSDDDSGVPWVSIGDMSGRVAVDHTAKRLTAAGVRDRRLRPSSPGTVLFAMYASVGEVSTLAIPAVWNQAILGLTPVTDRADSRFLAYWLRHLAPIARSQANSATQANLGADQVGNFPFPHWSVDDQRRIADFLDDRLDRIDRIVAARREQLSLTADALPVVLMDQFADLGAGRPASVDTGWKGVELPEGWRATTLGRVLRQLTNGYVGPTRDMLTDSGVRYIQSVHVKKGELDFQRRPFFVSREWHEARPRIKLRRGDVLIVQTGAVGQVALVPEGFGDASCHALLIARVNRSLISPEFLAAFLQSDFGYKAMLARATGALHPHLEGGVRSTPILLPPKHTQDSLVQRVQSARNWSRGIAFDLERSINLLTEYKTSLTTAAVSGEFDVTTAGQHSGVSYEQYD